MDNHQSVQGLDAHDYVSYAPYWWPNPKTKDGLPFIRKDGHVYEKLRVKGDQAKFDHMAECVQQLSLAFYFTQNEKYAAQAARFLRVWFLDSTTKMNPNVEGGQIILGHHDRGRRAGINELRALPNVIDAESLMMSSKSWTQKDHQSLKAWFESYWSWLTTSNHGKEERARPNNQGTWYDVESAAIALYLGKEELAKAVFETAKATRIKSQINIDGAMPLELERASSLHYTFYNITAMFALATLTEKVGMDLWNYTTPYIVSKKKWPYPDLRGHEFGYWPFLISQAIRAYKFEPYKELLSKAEMLAGNGSCTYCYRLTVE